MHVHRLGDALDRNRTEVTHTEEPGDELRGRTSVRYTLSGLAIASIRSASPTVGPMAV